MSDITCLSLSLSLKNSLDQTFRKLKKEENKRPETGFCINRQKIRSYEDKRRIWQHKVRTSDTYVKRIFGIELEFASVYFHGVFQGNVSWFVCTWTGCNVTSKYDRRREAKGWKGKKNANARTRTRYALFARVLRMRFGRTSGV